MAGFTDLEDWFIDTEGAERAADETTKIGRLETSARHRVGASRLPRVVLAEDDHGLHRLLTWTLVLNGYDVKKCSDGEQLIRRPDWSHRFLDYVDALAPRNRVRGVLLLPESTDLRLPVERLPVYGR